MILMSSLSSDSGSALESELVWALSLRSNLQKSVAASFCVVGEEGFLERGAQTNPGLHPHCIILVWETAR